MWGEALLDERANAGEGLAFTTRHSKDAGCGALPVLRSMSRGSWAAGTMPARSALCTPTNVVCVHPGVPNAVTVEAHIVCTRRVFRVSGHAAICAHVVCTQRVVKLLGLHPHISPAPPSAARSRRASALRLKRTVIGLGALRNSDATYSGVGVP